MDFCFPSLLLPQQVQETSARVTTALLPVTVLPCSLPSFQ